MEYMQTHGVFIPELCLLNNNKHCLTHNMTLQYISSQISVHFVLILPEAFSNTRTALPSVISDVIVPC
jgi:hypothetical protein